MKMAKLHLEIPPIIGYLHHAYQLSIAQEHPSFPQWFSTNYIQLRYYPKTNWLNFYRLELYNGFEYCPLLDFQMLKNEFLKTNQINIIDLVINCIKNGYYIWLYIDEYYDPNRMYFNYSHVIHESLLYGYNLNTNCFYSAGFNQQKNYSFSEISFSDFSRAFNATADHLPIKILKPNEKAICEFDIKNVKDVLNDYINSENTSRRNELINNITSDCVYGLDIYKYLKLYFESLLDNGNLSDIRMLHILWEHKKCMLLRIKYLSKNEHLNNSETIISKYETIQKKVLIMRNMQMKYNMTGNKKIIDRIVVSLGEISSEEKNILSKVIQLIS
jgi:hypothetical protein